MQRETTRWLTALGRAPEDEDNRSRLFATVYDELHRFAAALMSYERKDHTLQPTALVHETYLKLIRQDAVTWKDRAHFFAIAARAMRQVLVDHARAKATAKRGRGFDRITLDDGTPGAFREPCDLIDLHAAMKRLSAMDDRIGNVVELKLFGGLTMTEIAFVIGKPKRTVEEDWTFARMWLGRELGG